MRLWQPIPNEVKEELFAALSLSLLAFMDIRMPYDPLCTVGGWRWTLPELGLDGLRTSRQDQVHQG